MEALKGAFDNLELPTRTNTESLSRVISAQNDARVVAIAAHMAALESEGISIVPDKKETLRRLLEVEFSEPQLHAAKIYQYRGEFCPVKKGVVTYPDWFPTDKQIENSGVPILDVIRNAKADGRREAKQIYYSQGVADTEKRYEDNIDYRQSCVASQPATEIQARITLLDSREKALEIASVKANEREEKLQERERRVEKKEQIYRDYKESISTVSSDGSESVPEDVQRNK